MPVLPDERALLADVTTSHAERLAAIRRRWGDYAYLWPSGSARRQSDADVYFLLQEVDRLRARVAALEARTEHDGGYR